MMIVTLPDTLWTSCHGYWLNKPHNAKTYNCLMNIRRGDGLVCVLSFNGQESLALQVARDHTGCWEAGGVAKRRLDAGEQTLLDIFDYCDADLLSTALRAAETVPHSSIAYALGMFTRTVDDIVKVAAAAKRLTARVNVRARNVDFDQFMKKIEETTGPRLDQKASAVYAKFVAEWKEKVR